MTVTFRGVVEEAAIRVQLFPSISLFRRESPLLPLTPEKQHVIPNEVRNLLEPAGGCF
jgi:hypothetical protein